MPGSAGCSCMARLERVLVRGGKLDFLNLRTATPRDATFEGCVLGEPDFRQGRVRRRELTLTLG